MPSLASSSAGTEGNILLVEEYDALAAAIGSALRKFAPTGTVRVAASLAAAESLAAIMRPSLLVIDFDPPLAGVLPFFERMRAQFPETPVLIIAAGVSQEVLRERRLPPGLHFIEKPFKLEAFEAKVKLLLPSTAAPSGTSIGRLRDLTAADIVLLLCLAGATEILHVRIPGDERQGEVHFMRGQIRHASASGLEGMDALREMLRWSGPAFAAGEGTRQAYHSIDGKWSDVLRSVLRSIPLPLPPRKRPDLPKKNRKTIVVIDDTETLRDFVEEMLSTADPGLHIVTAADAVEGLARCSSVLPDLILLDYSLPDFNGDEVCRRLLEDEKTGRIPVIMMSGHVAEMAATATQYENVVLTLSKPFVSGTLIDAVAQTLAQPPPRKRRKSEPEPAAAPATNPETPRNGHANHKPNGHAPIAAQPSEADPVPPPAADSAEIPVSELTELEVTATAAVPAKKESERPLTPARIPVATSDVVVLSIPLEVVSMQFSPALRITGIRGYPPSPAVSLHVDPRAGPAIRLSEAAFEISRVDLDCRGQMQNVRLVPAQTRRLLVRQPAVALAQFVPQATDQDPGIQLAPAPSTPLTVQLLISFDLAGVELSPGFGVAHLGLNARPGRVRVVLPGQGGKIGVTFETAQVLLDRSARITEVLLDSVVA